MSLARYHFGGISILKSMDQDFLGMKQDILNLYKDLEEMKCKLSPESYNPQFDFNEFYDSMKNRTDDKVFLDIIRKYNIEYFDETWQESDWDVVIISGFVGAMLDYLITQTNVLKPLDEYIKKLLDNNKVTKLKDFLDKLSESFRNGESAPIDYMDFEMHVKKSAHEQYSFGHDIWRFVEGIFQFMTGTYEGVDKYGKEIIASYGKGIPNIIQAIISYILHMLSDILNKMSLPYPGSTFLMQFGSEKTREEIALAYNNQLFNARTYVYQGLPSLFMNLIISCYAIFDYYTQMNKVDLLIVHKELKYKEMLLAASAFVTTSNLSINIVRAKILKKRHTLFKINYRQIKDTVKRSIRLIFSVHKRIKENGKEITKMLEDANNNPVKVKTINEYVEDIEQEYTDFLKSEELAQGV